MKQVNPSKRLEHVQAARVYFMDFLQRCKDYDVCSFQLPRAIENTADTPTEEQTNPSVPMPVSQPDLIAMATQRQAKIERWVGTEYLLTCNYLIYIHWGKSFKDVFK